MLKNIVLKKPYNLFFFLSFLTFNFSFGQITEIDLQLAQKYFIDQDYEKAHLYYEKIVKEPQYSSKIYKNYKSTLLELGRFKEAEKLCKTQIKSFPNKLSLLVDLAVLFEFNQKQDKKEQIFDKAINQIQENSSYQSVSELGVAFERVGETQKALQAYLKYESVSSRNLLAFHSKIALIYNRQGNTSKMIDTFFEMLLVNDRFINSVQNGLVNSIDFESQIKEKEILRKSIIQKIQKNPKKLVFVELLAWFYMLNNDYENAFIQIKSLDKKLNQNGAEILELGKTALNNESFNTALKSFNYIIEQSSSIENILEAKNLRLLTLKTKLLSGSAIELAELEELKSSYLLTLNQLNTTKNIYNNVLRKYDLLVDLSEIEAYFLKDIKSAKEHLNKAMSLPSLKARLKASAKLKLADILVYEDNIWEASLMYKQIEQEFKSDAIGHQAKFKNAQGIISQENMTGVQAQLDVLKASTSKLIANDALELSVLITDNYNMDTSETPMKLFSYADMLSIQQQYDAAKLYDSILNNFQNHSLNDEIIFRKAKISLRQHQYHEAVNQLIELVKNYPSSILLDNSLFLIGCIYQENLKDMDSAKEYFKTLLFEHPGSLYITDARKRYRKLAGNTNGKILKKS